MWFKWLLIGVWTIETLVAIGKQEDGGTRIAVVLINGLLAAGLLYYWGK